MDAVLIENAAKARAVNNPGLEQEPRAFPSSRTACLKSQSYQVLGIDNANEYPLVLVHTRRVNRIDDQRVVRRQDLNRDTMDEHMLGVHHERGLLDSLLTRHGEEAMKLLNRACCLMVTPSELTDGTIRAPPSSLSPVRPGSADVTASARPAERVRRSLA